MPFFTNLKCEIYLPGRGWAGKGTLQDRIPGSGALLYLTNHIIYHMQFSSVQVSSGQFSSGQFRSVEVSSVQFSSVQFRSVQFSSVIVVGCCLLSLIIIFKVESCVYFASSSTRLAVNIYDVWMVDIYIYIYITIYILIYINLYIY